MTDGTVQSTAFQQYSGVVPLFGAGTVAFPRAPYKFTLNQRRTSEWAAELDERFNILTALPRGWDGYTGLPVSFTCAQFAAQLLERLHDSDVPAPSLVPGSDGTLQIEWHINQYDIEVDILGAFDVVAMRYDCVTGNTEEHELVADFTLLASWISDLKADRPALLEVGAL